MAELKKKIWQKKTVLFCNWENYQQTYIGTERKRIGKNHGFVFVYRKGQQHRLQEMEMNWK